MKSWIRIRISQSKALETQNIAKDAQNGDLEAQNLKRSCIWIRIRINVIRDPEINQKSNVTACRLRKLGRNCEQVFQAEMGSWVWGEGVGWGGVYVYVRHLGYEGTVL